LVRLVQRYLIDETKLMFHPSTVICDFCQQFPLGGRRVLFLT
jgi:hypothetical protein